MGTPFFVEPRFLFGFSAHKSHLSFAPMGAVVTAFAEELKGHDTTKHMLKMPLRRAVARGADSQDGAVLRRNRGRTRRQWILVTLARQ
ncbi:MAG TPA: hypothetical protein VK325_02915 [Pseudoxanthomonas sp.]|nr:hypothetical protein [Pseudoxanthomonas sp.]